MNKTTNQDKKIALYVLNEIAEKCNLLLNINIKDKLMRTFIETIKHYNEHKKEYEICVSNLDPYKICAWSLDCLIKETKNKRLIVPILLVMLNFLEKEGKTFSPSKLKYIVKMYKNNNNKDELAIGKNGLFMIFWSASNCEIAS
jgi:hypothetical protein